MEIVRLAASDWRGLDVEIPWQSVNVFFGRNDVGKSNILEAIASGITCTAPSRRTDPAEEPIWPFIRAILRVHHHVDTSADATALAASLQYGSWQPPTKPRIEDIMGPWQLDGYEFDLTSDPEAQSCAGLRKALRENILLWAADQCRDWAQVQRDYETVVDAALSSTLFQWQNGELTWLVASQELTEDASTALQRLADSRPLFESDVPLFADLATSRRDPTRTLAWMSWEIEFEALPIGVVDLSSETAYRDVVSRLEHHVANRHRRGSGRKGTPGLGKVGFVAMRPPRPGHDEWLVRVEQSEMYRVSDLVLNACEQLSALVTEAAPAFVRDRSEVIIEALPPTTWQAFEGQRLRISVKRRNEATAHPLIQAGRGIERWVLLTIEEVLRTHGSQNGGPQDKLYVFDEPERHLHPLAQADSASWLAEVAREGAHLAIATHATAFLDIPYSDVGYIAVDRAGGSTYAEPVTSKLVEVIRERSADYGLTPGEFLLLTRAILLVEGTHDERVIDHYYGRQLREQRIFLVPIHGTDNAGGVPETEFLSRVGKRLIVLFDNTLSTKLELARADTRSVRRLSKEERAAVEIVRDVEGRSSTDVRVVGFDVPDIIAAFPDDAVRRTAKRLGGTFQDWEKVLRQYRSSPPENFKSFLLRSMGLPTVSPGRFLAELMSDDGDRPLPGPLHAAIQEVIQSARSGS